MTPSQAGDSQKVSDSLRDQRASDWRLGKVAQTIEVGRQGSAPSISRLPRLTFGLFRDRESADFGATEISLPAPGPWRNVFTGTKLTGRKPLPANELFRDFPVAVLCAEGLG